MTTYEMVSVDPITNLPNPDVLAAWRAEFGGGGGGSTLPFVYPENYGAVGDKVTDDSAALQAAVDAAHTTGRSVWLSRFYRGFINAGDKNLRLFGPGGIVMRSGGTNQGRAIRATHTPGVAVTVSSVAPLIIGPITSKDSPVNTSVVTGITVGGSSLNQFKAGDVWRMQSDDGYEWSPMVSTSNVYQASMVPVAGISFAVTPSNGGPLAQNVITGASSGAVALVGSYARDAASTTGRVILQSISGTFTVGENFTVGGTVKGKIDAAGIVLMKGKIDGVWTTNIRIRKLPAHLDFVIDGPSIEAVDSAGNPADVDQLVLATNRRAGIEISNVVKPWIDMHVKSAWKEAVALASCWAPYVRETVDRLANNTETSEQAYGYGVEIMGCTEHGFFDITATNVRHAFTTNVTANTAPPIATPTGYSEADEARSGTSKDNLVTGKAVACWGSGFDTHEGAYRTTFVNCVNEDSGGLYRKESTGYGYQNRGFNTTYINCIDRNSTYGFSDGTGSYPTSTMSVTRFIRCFVDGFHYAGFFIGNASESANHKVIFDNCRARGDGRSNNDPYSSVGFKVNGVSAEFYDCAASRFSSTPIELSSPGATIAPLSIISNLLVDYSEAPTSSASGIRIAGSNPQTVAVSSVKIIPQGSNAAPSPVRVVSGIPTVLLGTDFQVLSGGALPNTLLISAGTPTIGRIPGAPKNPHVGSTAPALAITDDLWVDTTSGTTLKRYNGTAWV